jgi:tetratricopeptide (TPR) repeat protein
MFDRALQGLPPQHITMQAEEPAADLPQALARHQAGDIDAAVAAYLALLRQYPNNAEAAHLLGVALHQRGDMARAETWIERAISLAPAEPAFHDNIVQLHELAGQPAQALACLDRALSHRPEHAPWWTRRARLLQSLGRTEEALASQDRARSLEGNVSKA